MRVSITLIPEGAWEDWTVEIPDDIPCADPENITNDEVRAFIEANMGDVTVEFVGMNDSGCVSHSIDPDAPMEVF